MKLWTVQPQEVISIIEKTGEFICDETKSDKDFRKAYEWIAKEMDKRHIVHPEGLVLPLWAWHTRDWKHKKPDLRNIGLGTPGEKSVCIEFEIDDQLILELYMPPAHLYLSTYSMCVLGIRKPTCKEAEEFFRADIITILIWKKKKQCQSSGNRKGTLWTKK